MAGEIYRTTTLLGAEVTVFHKPGTHDVLLTVLTQGMAGATINIQVNPADLERLAADLLAAAQAIQMPRRAA